MRPQRAEGQARGLRGRVRAMVRQVQQVACVERRAAMREGNAEMTPWTMSERAEWELAERRNQRKLAARLGAKGLTTRQVAARLANVGALVDAKTVRRWMKGMTR